VFDFKLIDLNSSIDIGNLTYGTYVFEISNDKGTFRRMLMIQ